MVVEEVCDGTEDKRDGKMTQVWPQETYGSGFGWGGKWSKQEKTKDF